MAHARHKNSYRPRIRPDSNRATRGSNLALATTPPERPVDVPKAAKWNTETQSWEIKVPGYPPDEIYKYRLNRVNPASDRWGRKDNNEGTNMYITERIEYKPNEGIFVYYYGVPFPSRGVRVIESIQACLPPKRLLMNKIRFWVSFRPWYILYTGGWAKLIQKSLELFNDTSDLTLSPYYLKDEYYSSVVRQISKGIDTFLTEIGVNEFVSKRTAEIIGVLFEYDNAYLYRLQDIMAEARKEALLKNFAKEVSRLVQLEAERDHDIQQKGATNNDVPKKFKSAALFLKLAWYIPRFRKAIKKAVNSMDFKDFELKEGDIYHTLNYWNYDVRGIKFADRMRALEAWNTQLFGPQSEGKWPDIIKVSANG